MSHNAYLYSSWRAMHTRCYDPNYHSFHRYGGRGIDVCPQWHDWKDFEKTNPPGWKKGFTLDRIDNNKGYSPENCRWLPKQLNTKPLLVDPKQLLAEYNSGLQQKALAEMYGTDQPHISRILKKAREQLSG
jgi:hypothetical protein